MHRWPACALHKVIQSIAWIYAEPDQRIVQQSILSLAPVTPANTEGLACTTQAHWTMPVRGWHGSVDHCGETALPHSSKLSSPLVEPVAYPLGFSYSPLAEWDTIHTARKMTRRLLSAHSSSNLHYVDFVWIMPLFCTLGRKTPPTRAAVQPPTTLLMSARFRRWTRTGEIWPELVCCTQGQLELRLSC
jgi:hypothetical protein